MKRAALLHCANMELHRYKTLRHREQLPLTRGSVDDADSRQANYTLEDAFTLRLLMDLIGQGEDNLPSISPGAACSVVANAMMRLRALQSPHPLNMLAQEEAWVGVIVFEEDCTDDAGERDTLRFTHWYAGALVGVQKEITDLIEATGPGTRAVRVILTSATRAANFVRQRAVELGIPEGNDLYEDWSE